MTKKNAREWWLVLGIPFLIWTLISAIATQSAFGLLSGIWLPIGAIMGIFAGFSDAPIYTQAFKLKFAAALIVSILLIIFGFPFRNNLKGKILMAIGIYLWCIAGFIALSMSA